MWWGGAIGDGVADLCRLLEARPPGANVTTERGDRLLIDHRAITGSAGEYLMPRAALRRAVRPLLAYHRLRPRGPRAARLAIAGAVGLGLAYPAMAVYRGELFPTHQRSLAGGLIMTSSLMGGSIGLIGAGRAVDAGASYGSVMLSLLVFPVIASVGVWLRYPETAHLTLEDINPEDAAGTPTP